MSETWISIKCRAVGWLLVWQAYRHEFIATDKFRSNFDLKAPLCALYTQRKILLFWSNFREHKLKFHREMIYWHAMQVRRNSFAFMSFGFRCSSFPLRMWLRKSSRQCHLKTELRLCTFWLLTADSDLKTELLENFKHFVDNAEHSAASNIAE